MFEYFKTLRTTKSHLRYFDFCGNVLDAWGKTGGQQGDPDDDVFYCSFRNKIYIYCDKL
jgi:hypothetical protein